eukprot:COSAG04_NODE_23507_length_337_cov_0.836134_1_plen_49_part_01
MVLLSRGLDLTHARRQHIYLAGGFGGGNYLASAAVYDPVSNSYSPLPDM